MIKISLTECLVIGFVTVISGVIIQKIVSKFAEEDVASNNLFCNNKYNVSFWLLLFAIGVFIHLIVLYVDVNSWECQKVCTEDVCKIICMIPVNGITELLVTK